MPRLIKLPLPILFILSVLLVAVIRGIQGLDAFGDLVALIFFGVVLLPLVSFIFSAATAIGIAYRALVIAYVIFMLIAFVDVFTVYGFLTGGGMLTFVHGPVLSLPLIIFLAVTLVPSLRAWMLRGLLIGGGLAVGAALLVGILRSLQNLEPVWDVGTIIAVVLAVGLVGFLSGLNLFDPRRLFTGEAGLPRAFSLGILGILAGGLFVIGLRGLQNMDPLWDTGIGMVVIAFTFSGFFVWGMGAFDPKLSVHGEHHEEAHDDEAEEPTQILRTYIWQITFFTLGVLLVVMAIALAPGGPGVKITAEPTASTFLIGAVEIQLPGGGPAVQVSELVIFLGFVIFTMLSLGILGGGLALLFYYLSRNVAEVKNSKPTPEELIPPAPVQALGKASGSVADWVRRGLPKLLGQK